PEPQNEVEIIAGPERRSQTFEHDVRSTRPHLNAVVGRNVDLTCRAHSRDPVDDLILMDHRHCSLVGEGAGQPIGRTTLVLDGQVDSAGCLANGWPGPGVCQVDVRRFLFATGGEQQQGEEGNAAYHPARTRGYSSSSQWSGGDKSWLLVGRGKSR